MDGEADVRHRADEKQRANMGRPLRNLLASWRQEMMIACSAHAGTDEIGEGDMSDEI